MAKQIYTVAYPKSGVTWLIHILSDLLDSPQNGIELPSPVYWGNGHSGEYEIIKSHGQTPISKGSIKVLLIRDPRDVITSKHFFNGGKESDSIQKSIDVVCGNYEKWHREQLLSYGIATSYEALFSFPEIKRLYHAITGNNCENSKVVDTMYYQGFSQMKPIMDKISPGFMRRGKSGDWLNYFSKSNGQQVEAALGEFMMEFGYTANSDWWKELKCISR